MITLCVSNISVSNVWYILNYVSFGPEFSWNFHESSDSVTAKNTYVFDSRLGCSRQQKGTIARRRKIISDGRGEKKTHVWSPRSIGDLLVSCAIINENIWCTKIIIRDRTSEHFFDNLLLYERSSALTWKREISRWWHVVHSNTPRFHVRVFESEWPESCIIAVV